MRQLGPDSLTHSNEAGAVAAEGWDIEHRTLNVQRCSQSVRAIQLAGLPGLWLLDRLKTQGGHVVVAAQIDDMDPAMALILPVFCWLWWFRGLLLSLTAVC